jgi:hypothetical protein
MSGGPDLVSLLYHVDWAQLSLSAVANDGMRILVAPGQRYRVEAGDYLTGCNGDRPWRLDAEDAQNADGDVHWSAGLSRRFRSSRRGCWVAGCPAALP